MINDLLCTNLLFATVLHFTVIFYAFIYIIIFLTVFESPFLSLASSSVMSLIGVGGTSFQPEEESCDESQIRKQKDRCAKKGFPVFAGLSCEILVEHISRE